MKRILAIGDIHGKDVWKRIIEAYEGQFDEVVFLGDYVDDFHLPNIQILDNLKEIVKYKWANMKTVKLLLGNHDIQYLFFNKDEHRCSGRRPEMDFDLYDIFHEDYELFRIAHQEKDYLFTHAGVHRGWYMEFKRQLDKELDKYEHFHCNNVADELNLGFDLNVKTIFDCGYQRGGRNKVGGPLWADKNETYKKPLKGLHQIVGHTHTTGIKHYTKDENTSISYIDCLEDLTDYTEKELKGYGYLVTI